MLIFNETKFFIQLKVRLVFLLSFIQLNACSVEILYKFVLKVFLVSSFPSSFYETCKSCLLNFDVSFSQMCII